MIIAANNLMTSLYTFLRLTFYHTPIKNISICTCYDHECDVTECSMHTRECIKHKGQIV